jgi:hypothetical protein
MEHSSHHDRAGAVCLFGCPMKTDRPKPRALPRHVRLPGLLADPLGRNIGGIVVATGHPCRAAISFALIELAAGQLIAGGSFDYVVERWRVPRFAGEMVVVACYIAVVFGLFYSLGVNVTGIFATFDVETAGLREVERQTQLLARIRRFFGVRSNSARA